MANVFVITGTAIEDPSPGTVSWKFMFDSNADFPQFGTFSSVFGVLHRTDVWRLVIIDTKQQQPVFAEWRSRQDDLPQLLEKAIREVGDFVILMPRQIYDNLSPIIEREATLVGSHHHDGTLTTS